MKLLSLLLLGFLFNLNDAEQRYTVISPKALRLGAKETAILNLHGYTSATVDAYAIDLPHRNNFFSQTNLQLDQSQCEKPIHLEFNAARAEFNPYLPNQIVEINIVVTNSNMDFTKTLRVPVTGRSGYLFVTTDRPVYKLQDNEKATIKVFPLNQEMYPSDLEITMIIRGPDGFGIKKYPEKPMPEAFDSFISFEYNIQELQQDGIYTAEARYTEHGFETIADTTFKISKYVLPSFQVTLSSGKKFILPTDTEIRGTIHAEYSYGKKVSGYVFIKMKIKRTPHSPAIQFHQYPEKGQHARLRSGERTFSASLVELDNFLADAYGESLQVLFDQDETASIVIEVLVNGMERGVIESAEPLELPLLKSPYVIDVSRSSSYFLPNTDGYYLKADIRWAVDFKPAEDVQVDINVGAGETKSATSLPNGQINYPIDVKGETKQIIKIRTTPTESNPGLESQADTSLEISPYQSPRGKHLQINFERVQTEIPAVGENQFFVTFRYNPTVNEHSDLRYFILSRGSIVASGTCEINSIKRVTHQQLEITQAMVPSIRIVAYYMDEDEVVSNSIWLDVVDRCKDEMSVTTSGTVLPGNPYVINVKGSPDALVSLSAVDRRAYYIYNQSRLTSEDMFEEMESYDKGCVRAGGRDGYDVFSGAGLSISTRTHTPQIELDIRCPGEEESIRKKRSLFSEKAEDDEDILRTKLEQCETDGKVKSSVGETCKERAARVNHTLGDRYPGCSQKFLNACNRAEADRMWAAKFGGLGRSVGVHSPNNNDANKAMKRRVNFAETLKINAALRLNSTGGGIHNGRAQDSITTFDITTVSMQKEKDGFCVGPPSSIAVFKEVFVKVNTPYSLKKMEQTILPITVLNYGVDAINVMVKVRVQDVFCTTLKPEEWTELISFHVLANNAESTALALVPLRIPESNKGWIAIEISDNSTSRILDEIKKEIIIEGEGVLKDSYGSTPIVLDATHPHKNFDIDFEFPEQVIPGSRQCWVYAYTNLLGPTVEKDPITNEPRDLLNLIRMPTGCGEQTMIKVGPNVYTLAYLLATEREIPGTNSYQVHINRVQKGYKNELLYRSDQVDKEAWAVFASEYPSTWLNAYVNKVFGAAQRLEPELLDLSFICTSYAWLISNAQNADGSFVDRGRIYHKEMHGAVGGPLSLTAYVLISLLEGRGLCTSDINNNIEQSASKAAQFLNQNRNHAAFNRPFGLALLAYTMALHDPYSAETTEIFQRLLAMKRSSDGHVFWRAKSLSEISGTDTHAYWYVRRPLAVDIETTSYALLAQLAMVKHEATVTQEVLDRSQGITLWLIAQRNDGGGFTSTQDTVIGLQALSAYKTWAEAVVIEPAVAHIHLSLRSADRTTWGAEPNEISVDENNDMMRTTIDVPNDVVQNGKISVTATGSGSGLVSHRCVYRTVVEEDSCHFDLAWDYEMVEDRANRVKLMINVSKPVGEPTEMAIVEVGLLSGFTPNVLSLETLSLGHAVDGIIQRFEVTKHNVVLYLNEINENVFKLAFELEQPIPVERPQPNTIKVYYYNEPSVQCSTFYSFEPFPNIRFVNCDADGNNNMCKCAEGGCPACRTYSEQLDKTQCNFVNEAEGRCSVCRSDSADCEDLTTNACRRDFAYQVKVITAPSENSDGVFTSFTAEVQDVLLKGIDEDVGKQGNNGSGQIRTFSTRTDCNRKCNSKSEFEPEYVKPGTTMLLFGKQPEQSKDKSQQDVHIYHLDEDSVMERAMSRTACDKTTTDITEKKKSYKKMCEKKCKNIKNKSKKQKCKKTNQKNKQLCKDSRQEIAELEKKQELCKVFDRVKANVKKGCDNVDP